VDKLLRAFQKTDKDGKGKIGRFQLAELFQELDEFEWTPDDLGELFDAVDPENTGFMRYKKFLKYVMEDDNGNGTDDDSDSDPDDEDATDELHVHQCVEAAGLDLTLPITKNVFVRIATRLDEDENEAKEQYATLVKNLADDGVPTSSGVPLEDALEHFNIDPEDHDALKHLKKILSEVVEKEAKGEADAPTGHKILEPALDRLVHSLNYRNLPFTAAWDQVSKTYLSHLGKLELEKYASRKEELTSLVQQAAASPPLLPAHAGMSAAEEKCDAMVSEIIQKCKASGTKYTDPTWDGPNHASEVLYVDKCRPGYDCTVGKPAGWKRLSDLIKEPKVFKGGVRAGDIIQGQIGTCFLLGAIGALVSNNPKSIRKAFIKFDVTVGVFGVRVCSEGMWNFVIIDDYVPIDQYERILFASSKDKEELWVCLLEKAYCKYYRCYEMCDGGLPGQAIFTLAGGCNGKLKIQKKHRADPASYFHALKVARSKGWLLTSTFVVRRGAATGQGKCGEAVLPGGLVGGHVYSVLKLVDAGGNKLVCCRNPWGTGEWTGKWSDKNAQGEWTDAMKKACGYKGLQDGTFWMSIEDFVASSGGVAYSRTFGPPWKKLSQYRHFAMGSMEAVAQWAYKAAGDDEIGFNKGDVIVVDNFATGWWYGKLDGTAKKGFFPGNYVKLKNLPVARFDLQGTVAAGLSDMTAVVMLIQENVMRQRKFSKRKQDGLNYKVTKFPRMQLIVIGPDGKVALQKAGGRQSLSGELKLPGGGLWKIYCIALDGVGGRFTCRTYIKDGVATLKEVPGATASELSGAFA